MEEELGQGREERKEGRRPGEGESRRRKRKRKKKKMGMRYD